MNKMFSRKFVEVLSLGALIAALSVLPACSIHTDEKSNDGEKHVDIKSPLGDVRVDKGQDGEKHIDIKSPVGDLHVSGQADIRDAGLTLYPGAKPAPKDDSDDQKSANVNLSLPGFSLKVVAAEFTSDDAPGKIIAYYDKELQKYGKPIQCKGGWKGGGHVNASTDHGDKDLAKPVTCDNGSGDSVELKVGTEGNQHIVSVKPQSAGARFALVYVRMHTGSGGDTI